jgi:Cd(II)/Pb(II)-responsive transcriptional regulator
LSEPDEQAIERRLTMRIGELGQATGVDVETIRYYEKAGLLPHPARSDNGYRAYGPLHLERLAFIRHCRALDISLADVKRLLEFVAHPELDCGDIDRLIDAQLDRVRARLKSMHALEQQLIVLRGRCGESHDAGACGILHELVAAAHGESCACHVAPQFDHLDTPLLTKTIMRRKPR